MEAINLCGFGRLCWGARFCSLRRCCTRAVFRCGTAFFYADSLSALVVLLTAFVALVCSVYAVGYFREDEQNHVFEADVLGAVTIQACASTTP